MAMAINIAVGSGRADAAKDVEARYPGLEVDFERDAGRFILVCACFVWGVVFVRESSCARQAFLCVLRIIHSLLFFLIRRVSECLRADIVGPVVCLL